MRPKFKLVYWPAAILKRVSEPVTEPLDPEFGDAMIEKMYNYRGVGLSAVQVGVLKRIFVVSFFAGQKPMVVVNPVITAFGGERVQMTEGCLSVPGLTERVWRHTEITATYQDPDLTLHENVVITGFRAHVFQHEIEHLDGKLFLDHLSNAKRSAIIGKMQALRKAGKLR